MVNDGQYFDDMWMALEQELTQFDNFINDHDWMNSSSDGGNMNDNSFEDPTGESGLSPETYEELVEQITNKDGPSKSELRSKSREERIEAVRELYNQMPTIINATSLARLHRVANRLYRTGKVKEANNLMQRVSKTMHTDFSYYEDDEDYEKHLSVSINGDDQEASVQIVDKETNATITKTFDNILEAVRFYLNPEKEA